MKFDLFASMNEKLTETCACKRAPFQSHSLTRSRSTIVSDLFSMPRGTMIELAHFRNGVRLRATNDDGIHVNHKCLVSVYPCSGSLI